MNYLAICFNISIKSCFSTNAGKAKAIKLITLSHFELYLVIGMDPNVGKSLPAVPGTPLNLDCLGLLLDSDATESALESS